MYDGKWLTIFHAMPHLLDPATAPAYLLSRGLVDRGTTVAVERLSGGVSNVVLGVAAAGAELVLKQALPRLAVAEEWHVKRERASTEARALREARCLTPAYVPALVDADERACALVVQRAPRDWEPLKERLLRGDVDRGIARTLGRLLARWHTSSALEAGRLRPLFDDREAFDQLRVDPYYRAAAARNPDVAGRVRWCADRMEARRTCLVHGDFSPKNVLVGPDAVWVIDFEVAHWGDPAFDVAFMLSHLLLKALHRRAHGPALEAAADAFLSAYRAGVPAIGLDEPWTALQVGCLLLARVDGKSPVEYLDDGRRTTARTLACALLGERPISLPDAWALVRGERRLAA